MLGASAAIAFWAVSSGVAAVAVDGSQQAGNEQGKTHDDLVVRKGSGIQDRPQAARIARNRREFPAEGIGPPPDGLVPRRPAILARGGGRGKVKLLTGGNFGGTRTGSQPERIAGNRPWCRRQSASCLLLAAPEGAARPRRSSLQTTPDGVVSYAAALAARAASRWGEFRATVPGAAASRHPASSSRHRRAPLDLGVRRCRRRPMASSERSDSPLGWCFWWRRFRPSLATRV